MTREKDHLSDLGRITVKLPHGGERKILEYSDAPTAVPARPIGLLDASDHDHLAAIDALLLAEHNIGPMTVRRARDFLSHQEKKAARGKAAPAPMSPAERLIATRVIALSMKKGYGREEAAAVFGDIADRAQPPAAA